MSEVVFETERLIARRWDADRDAEQAFAIYGDPEVTRHFHAEPVADVSAAWRRLCEIIAKNERLGDPFGSFPLFTKAEGKLVGAGLMKPLPDAQGQSTEDIEVGWHLARAEWGNGYATEAGRALVSRCFRALEIDVVHAVVNPDNARSMAVAKRIGMRHVGLTSRYYGREVEHFVITRDEHAP